MSAQEIDMDEKKVKKQLLIDMPEVQGLLPDGARYVGVWKPINVKESTTLELEQQNSQRGSYQEQNQSYKTGGENNSAKDQVINEMPEAQELFEWPNGTRYEGEWKIINVKASESPNTMFKTYVNRYTKYLQQIDVIGDMVAQAIEVLEANTNNLIIPLFLILKRMSQLRLKVNNDLDANVNPWGLANFDAFRNSPEYMSFKSNIVEENEIVQIALSEIMAVARRRMTELDQADLQKMEPIINLNMDADIKDSVFVYLYSQVYARVKQNVKSPSVKYTVKQCTLLQLRIQSSLIILELPLYDDQEFNKNEYDEIIKVEDVERLIVHSTKLEVIVDFEFSQLLSTVFFNIVTFDRVPKSSPQQEQSQKLQDDMFQEESKNIDDVMTPIYYNPQPESLNIMFKSYVMRYTKYLQQINVIGDMVAQAIELLGANKNIWIIPLFLIFKRMSQLRLKVNNDLDANVNPWRLANFDVFHNSPEYMTFKSILEEDNELILKKLSDIMTVARKMMTKLDQTVLQRMEPMINLNMDADIKEAVYVYLYFSVYLRAQQNVRRPSYKYIVKQHTLLLLKIQSSMIIMELPLYDDQKFNKNEHDEIIMVEDVDRLNEYCTNLEEKLEFELRVPEQEQSYELQDDMFMRELEGLEYVIPIFSKPEPQAVQIDTPQTSHNTIFFKIYVKRYTKYLQQINVIGDMVAQAIELLEANKNIWIIPLFLILKRMSQLRLKVNKDLDAIVNPWGLANFDVFRNSPEYMTFKSNLVKENEIFQKELSEIMAVALKGMTKLDQVALQIIEPMINLNMDADIKDSVFVYLYSQVYARAKQNVKSPSYEYKVKQCTLLQIRIQSSLIILELPLYDDQEFNKNEYDEIIMVEDVERLNEYCTNLEVMVNAAKQRLKTQYNL